MATATKSKPKKSAAPAVEFKEPTEVKPTAKKKVPSKSAAPAKPTKKAAPAKKAVAAKTAPASKKPVKKAVPSKKPVKSAASKAAVGQTLPRDMNEHGFVKGSDSEKIVEILLEGGVDRADINHKVTKALGKRKTRYGNVPNSSSLIANILKRLQAKGYKIEASWTLVPPTEDEKKAAERKAKRAATLAAKAASKN